MGYFFKRLEIWEEQMPKTPHQNKMKDGLVDPSIMEQDCVNYILHPSFPNNCRALEWAYCVHQRTCPFYKKGR